MLSKTLHNVRRARIGPGRRPCLSALRGRVCVVEGSGLGFRSHADPARGEGHRLQLGLQLRLNPLLPGLLSSTGPRASFEQTSNKRHYLDQASGAEHPACVWNSWCQHSCSHALWHALDALPPRPTEPTDTNNPRQQKHRSTLRDSICSSEGPGNGLRAGGANVCIVDDFHGSSATESYPNTGQARNSKLSSWTQLTVHQRWFAQWGSSQEDILHARHA